MRLILDELVFGKFRAEYRKCEGVECDKLEGKNIEKAQFRSNSKTALTPDVKLGFNGFDMCIAIATTLGTITERLGLAVIPLIICTDSYLLYECLVKLETTKGKRLNRNHGIASVI